MKAGIGSAVAIIVAESLGLLFSTSAGIITLLTIYDTKKETLLVAAKRLVAFILAISISYILFNTLGYNPWVYGIFIVLFVGLSYLFNIKDGIAMNAVLMTHFLVEERIDWPLLVNELTILGIGMGIGIIINMIMPNYKKQIRIKQEILEEKIRMILKTMAIALKDKKACLVQGISFEDDYKEKPIDRDKKPSKMVLPEEKPELLDEQIIIDFRDLDLLLEELIKKAYEDAGNNLLSNTRYLISYLEMRSHQIEVLKKISLLITDIPVLLKQSMPLADFIEEIAENFHETNNVKGLLEDLKKLYDHYKKYKLPVTREEFEYRATLFEILKELEYFLKIKRKFMLEMARGGY